MMAKAILGRKLGMTQIFTEEGQVVPVTVVESGNNVVIQNKTVENDGYNAGQIGFGAIKKQSYDGSFREGWRCSSKVCSRDASGKCF